jgi:hypothetical protein
MSSTQTLLSEISPELVLVDPELRSRARLQLREVGDLSEKPKPGELAQSVDVGPREAVRPIARDRVRRRRRGARLAKTLLLSIIAASLTANALTIAEKWREPELAPTTVTTYLVEKSQAPPTQARSKSAAKQRAAQRRAKSNSPAVTKAEARAKPRGRNRVTVGKQARAAGPRRAEHETTVRKPSSTHSAQRAVSPPPATRSVGTDAARVSWQPVAGASYYNLVVWRGHRRVLDMWPTTTKVLLPQTWKYDGVGGSLAPGRYFWFAYPGFGPKASARYGKHAQSGVLIVSETKVSR